ncbi:hypothetical protein [Halobacillus sp. Marseille-Q1614]|uniref:hypothetical protein n=1 Tax=Halobacillus sp. Marseille-Q1614 TaxID=2709134 RepID=UPI0015711F85|nr:hypothetical protein [Halobacillus sp. Marseille-Q1614]
MVIVLYNCFHWVGYHCARQLLHRGHEVIGVDEIDNEKKEELYLYVGRNSHFQHFTTTEQRLNHCHSSEEEVQVRIHDSYIEVKGQDGAAQKIEVPALFGEWMEIDSSEIVTIDDLQFWIIQHHAVHVEDFLEKVIYFLEQGELPEEIERKAEEAEPQEVVDRIWEIYNKGGERFE